MADRIMKAGTSIHLPMRERKAAPKMDPYFPVGMKKYLREDGIDDGLRAIVNMDNNKTVGEVHEGYNLLTYRDGSNLVKDFLDKVGLKFESEGGLVGNAGSRYFERVTFPDYSFTPDGKSTALDIKDFGDHHIFGKGSERMIPFITMKNSYDKTSAVSWNYGVARLICSNGMAILLKDSTFMSYKHNQKINEDKVKDILLDNIQKTIDVVQLSYNRLNGEAGIDYLRDLIEGDWPEKFKLAVLAKINPYAKIESEEVAGEDGKHKILTIKSIETPESAWAIYNVATDVASHVLTSPVDQDKIGRRIAKAFALV